MSALLSFLGGSAFRMIWGELSSYFNKKQDHKNEIEFLKIQGELDSQKHLRQKELVQQQHELGIKEIRVAGDVSLEKAAAEAFEEAVKATGRKTGIAWVDAWNACIRPGGATVALVMIICEIMFLAAIAVIGAVEAESVTVIAKSEIIPDSTKEVLFAFLGIFVADRGLGKRGK